MARAGCAQDGCGRPFDQQSLRSDASGLKIVFKCNKGHRTTWSGSELIGRQTLLVNKLVPAAAVMTGLNVAPMKRFLGLLAVDSQNADYMKKGSLDLLFKLTKQMFDEEMERTRLEMLENPFFDAGMCTVKSIMKSIY